MNLFNRYSTGLLTTGIVLWLENLITIEWSYPYCLSQSDGPAYAAYGMPFPYLMSTGVTSLEYEFMPHVYILNVIVLSLLILPAARWVLKRVVPRESTLLQGAIGGVGCLLLSANFAFIILGLSIGYLRPTTSIGLEGYYSYSDFRPVRAGLNGSGAASCTPSPAWFPNGWQHD
jgi:hypothetical protein